jgi:Ca-activated chloride channel homolog
MMTWLHTITMGLALLLGTQASADNSGPGAARFDFNTTEGNAIPSVLLDSKAHIAVSGMTATVTLTQRYRNDSSQWVEGVYLLPLPEDAAVDSMEFRTEHTVVKGIIKEKQEAKRVYEQAKAAGKKAALVEAERPNLFTTKVANIAPNSEVSVTITYVQTIAYAHDAFSLRLPNTLTPRYIPRSFTPEEGEMHSSQTIGDTGWSNSGGITPAQTREPNNRIEITAEIKPGMELASVTSTSHDIDWEQNEKLYQVSLKDGDTLMNQDFVLSWAPKVGQAPTAAVFGEEFDGEQYTTLMLMPPQQDMRNLTLPREVVFVIDSSGSMQGEAMRQAKASLIKSLEYLSEHDLFNVIEFDDKYTVLFSDVVDVNAVNLQQAREFINNMNADGGTEIRPALEQALATPARDGFLKQVIFLTDGSVGNEQQLLHVIKNRLGKSRLFTIGIGSAPNSFFMRKAAEFGRGTFTYINSIGKVEQQISQLFSQLKNPVLRDIEVSFDHGDAVEILPTPIPDLYLGEPLVVHAKGKTGQQVTVRGTLLDRDWSRTVEYTQTADASGLHKVWARQKIEQLMDSQVLGVAEPTIRSQVLPLALKHGLVSKYTSFVAVEEIISRPQTEDVNAARIPNLMPKGNTMKIPYPQSATAAELNMFFGLLVLLLALALYYREQRRHIGNNVAMRRKSWIIALAVVGAGLIANGGCIHAKAWLAQVLIAHSWEDLRQHQDTQRAKPWPWADTWPVARLLIHDEELFVMESASGEAMSFGPGHVLQSALPGEPGDSVVSAHRDTHFAVLPNIAIGDVIEAESYRGGYQEYLVEDIRIADADKEELEVRQDANRLQLVSCYPFDAINPGGSLRYVVTAREVVSP